MSLILNIDTALAAASVSLSENGTVSESLTNPETKDHAAWLQPAIAEMLKKSGRSLKEISAVAVSNGPGSYTGLRVGLASAKGICFALGIPLITIGTLPVMANAVIDQAENLICPLIDARRMEVFTAVYDKNLQQILAPQAMILQPSSFESLLETGPVLFCGSGSLKLQALLSHPGARFTAISGTTYSLSQLSYNCFKRGEFADPAYSEPYYGKEFYTPARKN